MESRSEFIVTMFVFTLLLGVEDGLEEGENLIENHFDELLSLTELPMKKLLHVKKTFLDTDDGDMYHPMFTTNGSVNDTASTDKMDETPEAQALVGGHSKRVNPLINGMGHPRLKSPLRRGGGGGGHGPWEPPPKSKSKKGSISSIFQMSVTALAFLAFGGYLLCLIVNACRNGGLFGMNGMGAMQNVAGGTQAMPTNLVVLGGKRPLYGKRRKRYSEEEIEEPRRLENGKRNARDIQKIVDPALHDIQMSDALSDGESVDTEDEDSQGFVFESSTQETTAQIPKWVDDVDVTEEHTESFLEPEETLEIRDSASKNFTDDTEYGHWPLASIDDMYRALVMISEGYSLYHQALHTR